MSKLVVHKTTQAMTEEQMLVGCIKNNTAAQDALYNRFSPRMLAVCYRYAKNRDDAEDMLQESFIKVFSQLHQFRNEGALEGWIRRIVVHTCINVIKKNKKFSDTIDITYANELHTQADFVPSILQAKQIIECIRALPTGYRTVLNLYAIEGYSHKEIGDILEIAESSSRSQYTRARAMLESILIKQNIIDKNQFKFNYTKTNDSF
jgi:RNA polymerase sigma factor (sigma-70 family)